MFRKFGANFENNEFKDASDLLTFNVVLHYLRVDVDEINVSNVIPLLDVDKLQTIESHSSRYHPFKILWTTSLRKFMELQFPSSSSIL